MLDRELKILHMESTFIDKIQQQGTQKAYQFPSYALKSLANSCFFPKNQTKLD